MSELWGGLRAPVTLLGGYLGSGKTTLLNELLASADRRYAVLVNDLGSVNVDAALVRRQDGDTIELTDGCVCCSLVDGFALAFERLRERPEPPDHVLVELSGVADPARVAPWTGTSGFRLDGVLVLFDVEQGLERERDRWSGDTVQRQISGADLLVLTKRDLADAKAERRARARLSELAPRTPIILSDHGRLPQGWLGCFTPKERRAAGDSSASFRPPADSGVSMSSQGDHHVANIGVAAGTEREVLERWLQALPDHVVRVKGIVSGASGLLWVEGVGRRRRVRDAPGDLAQSEAIGTLVVISTSAVAANKLSLPPIDSIGSPDS